MKKVIPFIFGLLVVVSCNKEETNEVQCPTISRSNIPANALSHFDENYKGASNAVWFNVDSREICAVFDLNNHEYEVVYSNSGDFKSQEIEDQNEQEGEHEEADDDGQDEGCECDREDGDD